MSKKKVTVKAFRTWACKCPECENIILLDTMDLHFGFLFCLCGVEIEPETDHSGGDL